MGNSVVKHFNRVIHNVLIPDKSGLVEAMRKREILWREIICQCQEAVECPEVMTDHCAFTDDLSMGYAIEPINNIRVVLCLNALGSSTTNIGERFYIRPSRNNPSLHQFCDPDTGWISAALVSQHIRSVLGGNLIVEPAKSDMNAIEVRCPETGINCLIEIGFWLGSDKGVYLVSDDNGQWRQYQPHLERQTIANLQVFHNGNYLHLVRLLLYWNQQQAIPSIRGELANALVCGFCNTLKAKLDDYLDVPFVHLLDYVWQHCDKPVPDMLTGHFDVNHLSVAQAKLVKEAAYESKIQAQKARRLELSREYDKSLTVWNKVIPVHAN